MMHNRKSKTTNRKLQHDICVTHVNNFNHKKMNLEKQPIHAYNNHELAAQHNDPRSKYDYKTTNQKETTKGKKREHKNQAKTKEATIQKTQREAQKMYVKSIDKKMLAHKIQRNKLVIDYKNHESPSKAKLCQRTTTK